LDTKPDADVDDPQPGPPAELGRRRDEPDEPPVEERPEPLGRVEEVQRRPRRRRVDDDEVPGALAVGPRAQLPELLHRHVFLGPRERGRHGLVEGVGEDLLSGLASRVGEHDLVEGPLHVEHHRVEAAAGHGLGRQAGDQPRHIVELGEAERLGQATRRVDGQHDDPAPLLGGPQSERGGGRRLADTARPAADDDPGMPVSQHRVDVQRGGTRHLRTPSLGRPAGRRSR
jgi:hypothetical protein